MRKIIEIGFFGVLFCLAAAFLFTGAGNVKEVHNKIKSDMDNDAVVHEAFLEEKEDFIVTKADITALLMQDFLEYDILINDYTVSKELYNKYDIEHDSIKEGIYRKTYQYDSVGNIKQIIFISK